MTEGYYVRGISKRWAVILRAHGSDWAFRHFCEEDDTTWDQIAINEQARQFRHAHVVSPLSKHYSEYLSAVCNLPGYMFQELPYPIDIDRFTPIGRSNPDIIHNSLMTIGRLEHRKGSDVAVQAMNSVWKSVDDARLYMLGSESQFTRNSLAGLADKKHRGQVMFPGFIEHGHLPSYYRAIKAYFAPTQYETLGYTILEAMSCGVPVVACPTGAVPELVEDGVNGKLVPFGQPEYAAQEIINLLKDEPKRQNMGTKARETALKYSLNIIGAKHVEMYERARSIFIKQLGSKE
jgi:glycosyltransferase involved in cell wall biosynthesis